MMEESSGIFSKLLDEIRGPRGGLYLIMVGGVIIIFGCMGMAPLGAVTQSLSPDSPPSASLLYVFAAVLSLVSFVLLCIGFILVVGGGIYALSRNQNNRVGPSAAPAASIALPQEAPPASQLQRTEPPQAVSAQLSPHELTLEQRREILQREVITFVQHGYSVISETDTTAQLSRRKGLSCWGCLTLFIMSYTAWLIRRNQQIEQVYITVDANGKITRYPG